MLVNMSIVIPVIKNFLVYGKDGYTKRDNASWEMMLYVLQMVTTTGPVVLGVYDTLGNTMGAAATFMEKNAAFQKSHFFYDFKRVNQPAEWTNQQEAVWL
jgi:hypothetical protein